MKPCAFVMKEDEDYISLMSRRHPFFICVGEDVVACVGFSWRREVCGKCELNMRWKERVDEAMERIAREAMEGNEGSSN